MKLFLGRLIMTIHNHTFRYSLGTAATCPSVKDGLLCVKEIAQSRVHHTQPPECLCRGEHRGQITDTRHDQRICTTLIEVEHPICQLMLLR